MKPTHAIAASALLLTLLLPPAQAFHNLTPYTPPYCEMDDANARTACSADEAADQEVDDAAQVVFKQMDAAGGLAERELQDGWTGGFGLLDFWGAQASKAVADGYADAQHTLDTGGAAADDAAKNGWNNGLDTLDGTGQRASDAADGGWDYAWHQADVAGAAAQGALAAGWGLGLSAADAVGGQAGSALAGAWGSGWGTMDTAGAAAEHALGTGWGQGWGTLAHAGSLVEPDTNLNQLGDFWEQSVCQKYVHRNDCALPTELPQFAICSYTSTDFDCDGLSLLDEFCWDTDPLNPDTDADNWKDGPEAGHWKRPGDECRQGGASVARYDSSAIDDDADGRPNILDRDSDNDALQDGDEAQGVHNVDFGHAPTDPAARDTDIDRLSDYAELCNGADASANYGCAHQGWGSDPNEADTDGDGAKDGNEAQYWGESRFNVNYDGDASSNNLRDVDSDGDSWPGTSNGLDGSEVQANPPSDAGFWDTDKDGIPDGAELHYGLSPVLYDGQLDADADGLTNWLEYAERRPTTWSEASQGPWTGGFDPTKPDMDTDAVRDGDEYYGTLNPWKDTPAFYAGRAGSTNPLDADTDNDNLGDGAEIAAGTDPNDPMGDLDGDGLDDALEQAGWDIYVNGAATHVTSDFRTALSDGDGLDDHHEYDTGTDPRADDTDGDGFSDAEEPGADCRPTDRDSDGDGLDDRREHFETFTLCNERDTDGDGLWDNQEITGWTVNVNGQSRTVTSDPLRPHSDTDSLDDGQEFATGTDPRSGDTDGDGLGDDAEVARGLNPQAGDADGDGLTDSEEQDASTSPSSPDTDGDQLDDFAELRIFHTSPLAVDTDGDTYPDIADPRPLQEDQAPMVVKINSGDYSKYAEVLVADASAVHVDMSSFTFTADAFGGGSDCTARWTDDRRSVPSVTQWSFGKLTLFRIAFSQPLYYCSGYGFNVVDEADNTLQVEFGLTGDAHCLRTSTFATVVAKKVGEVGWGVIGGPVGETVFTIAFDYSQGGAEEVQGTLPITLAAGILGLAGGPVTAVVVGATGLLLDVAPVQSEGCVDHRTWSVAPQVKEPTQDGHVTDRTGYRVTLSNPGTYEEASDPRPGKGGTAVRGAGAARVQREGAGITPDGALNLVEDMDPVVDGDHRTYCAAVFPPGASWRVEVYRHVVVTAKQVISC